MVCLGFGLSSSLHIWAGAALMLTAFTMSKVMPLQDADTKSAVSGFAPRRITRESDSNSDAKIISSAVEKEDLIQPINIESNPNLEENRQVRSGSGMMKDLSGGRSRQSRPGRPHKHKPEKHEPINYGSIYTNHNSNND